jgi:hypothetical protein
MHGFQHFITHKNIKQLNLGEDFALDMYIYIHQREIGFIGEIIAQSNMDNSRVDMWSLQYEFKQ